MSQGEQPQEPAVPGLLRTSICFLGSRWHLENVVSVLSGEGRLCGLLWGWICVSGAATFVQFLLPSLDSVPAPWLLLLQATSPKKDQKNSHFDV